MNQSQSEGMLLAFAINQLLSQDKSDDPETPELVGCCRVHCGPCASLDWLRVNNPQWVRRAVIAAYGKKCWDWQAADGSGDVNWPQLTDLWDAWPGCSRSNDIWDRCMDDDLDLLLGEVTP